MNRNRILVLIVSMLAILTAESCSGRPRQNYDNGVSDAEYIRAASGTDEAQAFLDQFPEAEILVDRSGKLAVDFRFDQVVPASTDDTWQGIRLRVFVDPDSNRVESAFIQCSDQSGQSDLVEESLIDTINQYAHSQRCP